MPIDTTARPPAAPARKTPRAPSRPPAAPIDKTAARREALTGLGQVATALLVMRGAYADAGAIAQHSPDVSRETALLCESNENFASVVDYLTEAGPYMGLITAVMPLALQLAANHGKIDASRLSPDFGVYPPAILEARVKAELEAKRAEFAAEARKAQEASERMRDDALATANGRAS